MRYLMILVCLVLFQNIAQAQPYHSQPEGKPIEVTVNSGDWREYRVVYDDVGGERVAHWLVVPSGHFWMPDQVFEIKGYWSRYWQFRRLQTGSEKVLPRAVWIRCDNLPDSFRQVGRFSDEGKAVLGRAYNDQLVDVLTTPW